MIKGGKPDLKLHIEDYAERKGGHQSGIVVVTRDGIPLGRRRTKFTDDRDMEKAAQWSGELGFVGPDAGIQAAWNQAKSAKDQIDAAPPDGYRQPAPSKHAQPAKWVVDQLQEKGRFLKYFSQHYYFNGVTRVPVAIDESFPLQVVLRQKFGINRKDEIYSYAVHELAVHAELEGEEVRMHQFAHYDPKRNVLYVDMGNGHVLRCTGGSIEPVENAADGVMFMPVMFQRPWKYIPNAMKLGRLDEMIGRVSFAEGEETPLTTEQQRLLFKVWMISLFFKSELPTRPIALAYGQSGSGKTSTLEQVGQVLYGPDFRADKLKWDKEDDFWTTVSNRPYVVYDNADGRIRWLDDALAQTATGAQVSKRTLHKTNELSVFQVDVFLGLTARTPRFRREDVAERLLLFYFERIDAEERLGQLELHEWISVHRDEILSELVELADQVLLWPRVRPRGSAIRMVDFAAVAERIGTAMGHGPEVVKALERQRGAQTEFASEENPLVAALDEWLSRSKDGAFNTGRQVQARDLASELAAVAEDLGLRWEITNAESLGRAMSTNAELLAQRFEIVKGRKGGRGAHYRIRHKLEAEGDESAP